MSILRSGEPAVCDEWISRNCLNLFSGIKFGLSEIRFVFMSDAGMNELRRCFINQP